MVTLLRGGGSQSPRSFRLQARSAQLPGRVKFELSTIYATLSNGRNWPDSDRWSIGVRKCCCLNFCLFRHLKRIVNLDAQVSHCAFKLGMAK